jgi:hypothetical protein
MALQTLIVPAPRLTTGDLAAGAVIAVLMMGVFAFISSGASLIVTFGVGILFACAVLLLMWRKGAPLPAAERFLPVYFLALAMQFLHFTEEFTTGFAERFPHLYGGEAYSPSLFVGINMISYALFVLSALAVFFLGVRRALTPALFFVVYGVMGNAIAHLAWSIMTGGYFPGLFTSLVYWALGPWLLYLLLGDKKQTAALIGVYATVLVAALTWGRLAATG